MNVSLTPKLEELVRAKLATGLYNSASEVVREGLRLLEERDRLQQIRLESLKDEITTGLQELKRGDTSEYDDKGLAALAKSVKTRGRKRLAAKKKRGARSIS